MNIREFTNRLEPTLTALSAFNTNGLVLQTSLDNFTATSVLSVIYGGTGATALTTGGVLYGNGTGAIQATSAGTNGQVLWNLAGVPAWIATSSLGLASSTHAHSGIYQPLDSTLTSLAGYSTNGLMLQTGADTFTGTSTLSVSYGGTGSTSLTGMLKGSGTGIISVTGTTGYAAYWADANTIGSEQYLANTRGGTAQNSSGWTGIPYVTSGTWSSTSSLAVNRGGTGLASSGAAGNLLISDGNGWASVTMGTDATIASNGALTIADNAVDGTDISISSEANGSLMYFDGTNWVNLAAGTSGQLLKANGAAAPAWASTSTLGLAGATGTVGGGTTGQFPYYAANGDTLSATSSLFLSTRSYLGVATSAPQVLFTVGGTTAGSAYFGVGSTGIITSGTWNGSTIGATYGGTGLASIAADNIIYTSGSNTFSATPITTIGRSLIDEASTSTARTALGLAIGSDVQAWNWYLQNISNGTWQGSTTIAVLGTVTTGTWQGTAVGAQYGGTGINTSAANGIAVINSGTWSASTTLAVNRGGTGAAALTTGGVLYGNGTGAIQATSAGTNGQVLWNLAGVPAWIATSSLGLASSTHAHSGIYQPLDSTLTSLAGYSTNGLMLQTGADTFTGTSTLSVSYGGTGSTSLTGMLKGSGTGIISVTGTTGYAAYWADANTIGSNNTWLTPAAEPHRTARAGPAFLTSPPAPGPRLPASRSTAEARARELRSGRQPAHFRRQRLG